MEENRKYLFNLPWSAVLIGTGFYAGLAVWAANSAKEFVGVIHFGLIALSVIFAILALIMLNRRILFPRILELSEQTIFYPRGFPKTRIVRVNYADIIRIGASGERGLLEVVTAQESISIYDSQLRNTRSFLAVRDYIYSRTLSEVPRRDEQADPKSQKWSVLPEPILQWKEPEDWARYRTSLYTSRPLLQRLGKELWFFARCFPILLLPWPVLILCGLPTSPADHILLALAITILFTLIHWLGEAYAASSTEISFRNRGISQFFGKQTIDHNYSQVSGWTIVERRFEDRSLLILLLRSRGGVWSFALPGPHIRDQLVQIFRDKQVPHVPDLRPSWE